MSAIDPRFGTWKLNVAKSKFSPAYLALMKQSPPKEGTVVLRELGTDELELIMTGTQADGKPIAIKSVSPRQGGAVKIQQSPLPEGTTLVLTRIDPNNSFVTYMLNGKQVLVSQSIISKNGKTMRNTAKGTDAQGKPFEHVTVFDKQ